MSNKLNVELTASSTITRCTKNICTVSQCWVLCGSWRTNPFID